ncbi:MAG: proprotein convertase P-domain-containing protein [Ardenticatenaceae bacterium]|nr:proprotein convertase P-domain-containing protein [Ardenticatenaceae bacterium]
MSERLRRKMIGSGFLFVAVVFGIWLLVAVPSQSTPETAVSQDTAVQLLAPGGEGGIVEFALNPNDTTISEIQQGTTAAAASYNGDVRDLPQVGPAEKSLGVEFELFGQDRSNPNFIDSVRQTTAGLEAIPSPSQSFAGLDLQNWGAGWPPDTQGDVGPNHYIQAVNTSIGIYSKTGQQLAAFTFDTLFDGTGTSCDADNNGDPVVLYDNVSGRWIISDFAWTNTQNGPYYECIAVSKTADPVSGGWWFYGLRADDASHPWLNDYPKMGAWHDGIYMTANMFDCLTSTCSSASYKGVRIWALNRDNLINGQPINYQLVDLGSAYFSLLPANAKTTMPSAGTPNYLMSLQTTSTMYTWKMSIDWNNSANSTLTGPVSTSIASYSNAGSVPQGGSSTTLDSLAGRLMAQLQYSKVGSTESLWVTHSVSSGGVAGIRWYEFRNLSGTPSVYQQSTYSPDSTHRWMGSVAVDSQGNMAVGYSASSASINPQIRYAGRLASDPLNALSQGEGTLIAGTGSQTSYNRWGDYSAMTVDVDGCTFWYTTEYYTTTGTNWQTRIGSFAFPGCSGGPTPTPGPTATATPLPTATNTPGPTTCTVYSSTDVPVNLPNGVSAITSNLNVGGSGTIADVNFTVNMSHVWVGDIGMAVTHQDTGTSVTVLDRPGVPASTYGCSGDNVVATLDDEAALPVENQCAGSTPTISGTFTPNNALSAFDGQNSSGTWILTVTDYYPAADAGALNSWSLEICTEGTGPTPTNTPVPPTPTNTPIPPTPTNTTVPPTPTNTSVPPTPTNTAVPPTPTNTPEPGSGILYVSSTTNGNAGGLAFADEDIVAYNIGNGSWSMFWDGSAYGITADLNAFDIQNDGTILMSFDAAVSVSGLGTVDDSDIVRFTPATGTFAWYFDGSDVGLTTTAEDIDAIGFAPDGRLLLSTTGNPSVTGVSGTDEDLLAFSPSSLGSTTAGTWSLYFDGSDVGLNTSSSEDITGVWVDGSTLYLTALGAFSVTGVSGDGADIFTCTGSFGSTTSCAFAMYWDGSVNGFAGEITDGLDIVP